MNKLSVLFRHIMTGSEKEFFHKRNSKLCYIQIKHWRWVQKKSPKRESNAFLSSSVSDTTKNASLHSLTVKASNPVFLVSTSQNYPVNHATKTGDHQRRAPELWIATT